MIRVVMAQELARLHMDEAYELTRRQMGEKDFEAEPGQYEHHLAAAQYWESHAESQQATLEGSILTYDEARRLGASDYESGTLAAALAIEPDP